MIIHPCKHCGNTMPWTWITYSCCVLRCSCGIELHAASVRGVYKKVALYDGDPELLPPEIEQYANPADGLTIIERGTGREISWPEHGYWSVPVDRSFEHFGHAAKWNRVPG